MSQIATAKRLTVVKLYFSGLSYDEISAKCGVSKGTVANVITELKAGRFPEAPDAADHIEELRELSSDLRRLKLNPLQCATGLTVLARINESGLDPADIDRWPLILKSIKKEDEAQEFVRLIYSIQEVQKRTGLSLDNLDNKVHELEKKASELKPAEKNLKDCKKQVAELTTKRGKLIGFVAELEHKYELLNPRVKDLEKREHNLSLRITDIEPKAQKAEATLATLNKEIQKLQDIGLPLEELTGFSQKVQQVAKRHAIKPDDLSARLLHELENLDRELGLEGLIESQQRELNKREKDIARTENDLEAAKAVVNTLKQEKLNLETAIKEIRDQVAGEIRGIIPVTRNTLNQFVKELRSGIDKAIAEVHRLRDESLEIGKEVGRFQGILETNQWLKELLALVQGEPGIEAKRVRAVAIMVLRGVSIWLKVQDNVSVTLMTLPMTTGNLIRELEQWKVYVRLMPI